MITNNWYKAFQAYFGYYEMSGVDVSGSASNIAPSSSSYWVNVFPQKSQTPLTELSTSKGGVYFGDGNTPPTRDDYFLSGNIVSTFSVVAQPISSDYVDGKTRYTKTYILQNTGSEAITISEVCWVAKLGNAFMLDRTLLDTPVTIQPGEQGAIVYSLCAEFPA